MARVEITESLFEEIEKTFRGQAKEVIDLMKSLEDSPAKGKEIGVVGRILIKELRYKNYRFFFITDGFKIKCLRKQDIEELVFKFVRMADKKNQQKVIDEIKYILKMIGTEGF